MRQQRICEYLGLKCSHRLSILSLTPDVRHQIYKEADRIDDSDIDLGRFPGTDSWDFDIYFGAIFFFVNSNS